MAKINKDKNYFKIENILEIIKWTFNNKDVNFLYASVESVSKDNKPFVESNILSIKNKTNIFVASSIESFVNELLVDFNLPTGYFEQDELAEITLDIGVAHSQDIKKVANNEYKKTSKTITFGNEDEFYDFVDYIADEIEKFLNSHTVEEAHNEFNEGYSRLQTLVEVEEFDFILSTDDLDAIETMGFKKTKTNVHRVKQGEEDLVIMIDSDLVM